MKKKLKTHQQRVRRRVRVRKKVTGTAQRPRLSVRRSNRHFHVQVIDDVSGHTLAAVSTLQADAPDGNNLECARAVGKTIGERAKAAGVQTVIFDRGGCKYHGRVKALADAAREAGLEF